MWGVLFHGQDFMIEELLLFLVFKWEDPVLESLIFPKDWSYTYPTSKACLTAQLCSLSGNYIKCILMKHNKEYTVLDGNNLPTLQFLNLPHSTQGGFI